jgi:hypothetical protein
LLVICGSSHGQLHSQHDSALPLTLNCLMGWLYSSVTVIQDLLLLTHSPAPQATQSLLSQVCSSRRRRCSTKAAAERSAAEAQRQAIKHMQTIQGMAALGISTITEHHSSDEAALPGSRTHKQQVT